VPLLKCHCFAPNLQINSLNGISCSRRDERAKEFAVADSLVSMLARLHREEEGQGMVEYVLIIALVALAATAGMTNLAKAINSAFSKVGSLLNSYV